MMATRRPKHQPSLRDQKIARILTRSRDRRLVGRIADEFIREGIIEDTPEAHRQRILKETRTIIGSFNKRQRKLGRPEKQVLSLPLYNEDGERIQFYKRVELMDQSEAEAFAAERCTRLRKEVRIVSELLLYFGNKYSTFIDHMRAIRPEVDQYLMDFMNDDDPDIDESHA